MLSTEKQRPNTAYSPRNDKSIIVRPKTAATQRSATDKFVNSRIGKEDQEDLLIDNDYTFLTSPRGRKLMKNGNPCVSASTARPKIVLKERQRPKTAPATHQIPLDQDLKIPILDESEYLYLHVPDDGTDSEGEHYVTNRRPRIETKSNRGAGKYLYYLSKLNGSNVRIVKGQDVEAHIERQIKSGKYIQSNVPETRMGMRNTKKNEDHQQNTLGLSLRIMSDVNLYDESFDQFITPFIRKKSLRPQGTAWNPNGQTLNVHSSTHLSTARRKSLKAPEVLIERKKSVDAQSGVLALSPLSANKITQGIVNAKSYTRLVTGHQGSNQSILVEDNNEDDTEKGGADSLSRRRFSRLKSINAFSPTDFIPNPVIEKNQKDDNANDTIKLQAPILDDLQIVPFSDSFNQFSLSTSDNPLTRNILRQMNKANKKVERRINPVEEPKIYQKRPVIRDTNPTPKEEYDQPSEQVNWSELQVPNNLKRRSFIETGSFVTRRLSVVLDRNISASSQSQAKPLQDSNKSSTTNTAENLSDVETPERRGSTRRSSAFLTRSDGPSRRSSETKFLGPSINVNLIIHLTKKIPGLSNHSTFNSLKPSVEFFFKE